MKRLRRPRDAIAAHAPPPAGFVASVSVFSGLSRVPSELHVPGTHDGLFTLHVWYAADGFSDVWPSHSGEGAFTVVHTPKV